jgi:hypothetical protein
MNPNQEALEKTLVELLESIRVDMAKDKTDAEKYAAEEQSQRAELYRSKADKKQKVLAEIEAEAILEQKITKAEQFRVQYRLDAENENADPQAPPPPAYDGLEDEAPEMPPPEADPQAPPPPAYDGLEDEVPASSLPPAYDGLEAEVPASSLPPAYSLEDEVPASSIPPAYSPEDEERAPLFPIEAPPQYGSENVVPPQQEAPMAGNAPPLVAPPQQEAPSLGKEMTEKLKTASQYTPGFFSTKKQTREAETKLLAMVAALREDQNSLLSPLAKIIMQESVLKAIQTDLQREHRVISTQSTLAAKVKTMLEQTNTEKTALLQGIPDDVAATAKATATQALERLAQPADPAVAGIKNETVKKKYLGILNEAANPTVNPKTKRAPGR